MHIINLNHFILPLLSLIIFCQASCSGWKDRQQSDKVKKTSFSHIIKDNINEREYLDALKNSFISELDSVLDVSQGSNNLKFTLSNKNVVVFEDSGNEDELEYKKYSYLGNLNKGFALFSVDGYEHSDLFLINMEDGTQTDLISLSK
ncbi:MAG: hypothetical protein LBE37_19310 [Sphingobacterium sp.]|jgi:hypothetical protein|nr:hypothetical protein [Sphingobacterium sp.]